jgi:3-oxoacyl-ACP reductase-like protein
MLLNCVHGGTLWIDPLVSIGTVLIAWIIGLPKFGEDPTILFNNKGERAFSDSLKEKFHKFIEKRVGREKHH